MLSFPPPVIVLSTCPFICPAEANEHTQTDRGGVDGRCPESVFRYSVCHADGQHGCTDAIERRKKKSIEDEEEKKKKTARLKIKVP